MACPLTAATTSLRTSHARMSMAAAVKPSVARGRNVAPPALRSAPEQNAGGVPVRTTAPTPSSASHRR